MTLQIVTPKVRGFICTNAHPAGCARNVLQQISYVREHLSKSSPPLNVLVIGASTGYGLASRIVTAFGYHAQTMGVYHERMPDGERTATAGYYNSAAFHTAAQQSGLYARSFNGDAFSDEIKRQVFEKIRSDWGGVDYVIYSLASPRRLHPRTGVTYYSAIKPIGRPCLAKSVDINTAMIHDVELAPASEEEIAGTQAVMGGEDWSFWIQGLLEEKLLNKGARTAAYSYIGPEQTWSIYRSGTIGKAKDHLESAAQKLDDSLRGLGGNAWVSINKAVVTQSSAAIPVVPLYLAILYRIMKARGVHEDCIEQITRLFADHIGPGENPRVDSQRRIRLDDREMSPEIQREIVQRWNAFRSGAPLEEFPSYRKDFRRLFGFEVDGVDYSLPVETAAVMEAEEAVS